MENLYQAPESNIENVVEEKSYDYKLFKTSAVGVATFFGTVLAGGYIIYRNYKALGKEAEGKKVLIWSAIATVLIFAVTFLIPDSVDIPNSVFTVAQVIAMVQLAKKWFELPLSDHEKYNGKFESNWLAFGISLLIMLVVLVCLIPVIYFLVW